MYLHVQAPTGSVVDRFDADPDPDSSFHLDADLDPDLSPSFTHAVKSEKFFLL
jgi:hypothetical protein